MEWILDPPIGIPLKIPRDLLSNPGAPALERSSLVDCSDLGRCSRKILIWNIQSSAQL
jgi:hypothetical protein